MSGRPSLRLAAEPDGPTARLVRALDRLAAVGTPFCLVGGLAVLARVGSAYRATSDVDAIAEEEAGIVTSLHDRHGAALTVNGVVFEGTRLDVIEIGPVGDPGDLPDDRAGRHFVLAHRLAFDSAEPVAVEVVDPASALVVVRAEVDVATPAALVAMKLGAYPSRRGRSVAKQGSDLLDLLALLDRYDRAGSVAAELALAPHGLGAACAEAARRLLVDDAAVAAGRIRRYTASEVDAAWVATLARRFVAAVDSAG